MKNELRKNPKSELHIDSPAFALAARQAREGKEDKPLIMGKVTTTVGADEVRPRTNPDSLISRLSALNISECLSEVEKVDPWIRLAEFTEKGHDMRDKLRNRVQSSVRAAAQRNGTSYQIEVGNMITTPGHLYLVAVITRYK